MLRAIRALDAWEGPGGVVSALPRLTRRFPLRAQQARGCWCGDRAVPAGSEPAREDAWALGSTRVSLALQQPLTLLCTQPWSFWEAKPGLSGLVCSAEALEPSQRLQNGCPSVSLANSHHLYLFFVINGGVLSILGKNLLQLMNNQGVIYQRGSLTKRR